MHAAHLSVALLAATAQAVAQVKIPGDPPVQTSLSPQESSALYRAYATQLNAILTEQPSVASLFQGIPTEIPSSDRAEYESYQRSLAKAISTGGPQAEQTGDLLSALKVTELPAITQYPWISDLPPSILSEYEAFETSYALEAISLGRQVLATAPGAAAATAAAASRGSTGAAAPVRTAAAGGALIGAAAVAAWAL